MGNLFTFVFASFNLRDVATQGCCYTAANRDADNAKLRNMKKIIKVMLKVLGGALLILLVAFIGLAVYAKFFYSEESDAKYCFIAELPLQPSEFVADFEEVHQIVVDNYSLYEGKKLDMDSLYHSFSERVRQAQTTTDYGLLLQEYFAALKCGHASTHHLVYYLDAKVRFIEGSVFISQPNDELQGMGFRDKDRIVAIDGTPIEEWMTRIYRLRPASTAAYKRLSSARAVVTSLQDSLRTYSVERGTDTLSLQVRLKRYDGMSSVDVPVRAEVLQDSIGYLSITSMNSSAVGQFTEVYPEIKDLPYLIVDIRENGGGNSGVGRQLCQYFIRKEQTHCVGSRSVQKTQTMVPEADAYKGKIYLLTSTYTFSAAESFAIDMWESGNVTLVGEPTAGDTGNSPMNFCTACGTSFRVPTRQPTLSPKGFPMEGVGVPPHYEVHQTIEDYMKGKDTVLDFVIGLIKG